MRERRPAGAVSVGERASARPSSGAPLLSAAVISRRALAHPSFAAMRLFIMPKALFIACFACSSLREHRLTLHISLLCSGAGSLLSAFLVATAIKNPTSRLRRATKARRLHSSLFILHFSLFLLKYNHSPTFTTSKDIYGHYRSSKPLYEC